MRKALAAADGGLLGAGSASPDPARAWPYLVEASWAAALPHARGAERADHGQGVVRWTHSKKISSNRGPVQPSRPIRRPASASGPMADQVAIRRGKRPDGTLLGRPCRSASIAASPIRYRRRRRPTCARCLRCTRRGEIDLQHQAATNTGVRRSKADRRTAASDKVAYGAYLAGRWHCVECHTPMGPIHRHQFATLLGAAHAVQRTVGLSVAKNITADPSKGSASGPMPDRARDRAGIDKDGIRSSRRWATATKQDSPTTWRR